MSSYFIASYYKQGYSRKLLENNSLKFKGRWLEHLVLETSRKTAYWYAIIYKKFNKII